MSPFFFCDRRGSFLIRVRASHAKPDLTGVVHGRNIDVNCPFSEITKVFDRNEGIAGTIAALSKKRNDNSHGRRPDEDELGKFIVLTSAEAESLYEALDCLSPYPLRDIISVHPTGRRNSGTYICKELVGDHPVAPTLTIAYEGNLPACGLHIVDQHGKPHFVEPWIVRRSCGQCRREETYVLDRYLKDKSISLKSLEYGHKGITKGDILLFRISTMSPFVIPWMWLSN